MYKILCAQHRGHANYGWLDTNHTFSFGDYYNPEYDSFRSLRVMNEDVVAPGKGFGTHPHRDMEIVTYVLEGKLEHKDSMGNGEVLTPGEFQRMTAGTGITHSEFNPSTTEPVHLYQIWLFPERKGLAPSYEQKRFDEAGFRNKLCLVASRDQAAGSLLIHQDARIYVSRLDEGTSLTHKIDHERHIWLQVLRGKLQAFGETLSTGDGLAVSAEKSLTILADTAAEIMLFDLN
jgi:redox-sensitive bicupin YhaK (pirin superfamily)